MKVRFVTGNAGKAEEARTRLAPYGIELVAHATAVTEIQADRLEDVAAHKAGQLVGRVPPPFFVEDAGLFVDALDGFPGVYSAYAFRTLGNAGLLRLLEGRSPAQRSATFRAVIAYADAKATVRLFAGEAAGRIATKPQGTGGFGFDPIFIPEGDSATFAQLGVEPKGRVSHRGRALDALATALQKETSRPTDKPNKGKATLR